MFYTTGKHRTCLKNTYRSFTIVRAGHFDPNDVLTLTSFSVFTLRRDLFFMSPNPLNVHLGEFPKLSELSPAKIALKLLFGN